MNDRRIPLGLLIKPHGLRGALRIRLHDPTSTSLRRGVLCEFERAGEVLRTATVSEVRGAGPGLSVQFEGVETVEAAEELRGVGVFVRRDALPALEQDEFYVDDVLGAEVFERTADGQLELKGRVTGFERYPSTDVLAVTLEANAAVVEVPLLAAYVTSVDAASHSVVLGAGALEELTP